MTERELWLAAAEHFATPASERKFDHGNGELLYNAVGLCTFVKWTMNAQRITYAQAVAALCRMNKLPRGLLNWSYWWPCDPSGDAQRVAAAQQLAAMCEDEEAEAARVH